MVLHVLDVCVYILMGLCEHKRHTTSLQMYVINRIDLNKRFINEDYYI